MLEEANRLYPPITAISRAAVGPDEIAGHAIKRGTMIVIAPYVLHRALWTEPEYFDPTRFLNSARERIPRFAYLPFGAGPRTCIGANFAMQEASIVLATLVRHFCMELPPGHPVWPAAKSEPAAEKWASDAGPGVVIMARPQAPNSACQARPALPFDGWIWMKPIAETRTDQSAIDIEMMQRCIRLSATAAAEGEFPFAAVICDGGMVVSEATNQVAQNGDVTQHAELVAVAKAQLVLGRKDLSTCTIYSNVEPCAMCSFPIRETRITRVVYAIGSPLMGGFSRWNVLRDTEISNVMPEAFGPIPEVVAGLLQREAEKVWRKWNPVIWRIIKHRGCFGSPREQSQRLRAIPTQIGFLRRLLMQYRNRHSI